MKYAYCFFICFVNLSAFAVDVPNEPVKLNPTDVKELQSFLPANQLNPFPALTSAPTSADGVTSPITTITSDAKSVDSRIQPQITTATNTILPVLFSTGGFFAGSFNQTQAIQTSVADYFATKKNTCVSMAEKASFLCADGTSPGAKAVKTLMDVGAPVLSVISSAQKACSTSAKLTSLAGTALTVAKGVCVAAKATCDMTCAGAKTKLGAITAQLAQLQTTYTLEVNKANAICSATTVLPMYSVLCSELREVASTVPPAINSIEQSLKMDSGKEPGTVVNVADKCTGYAKDIVLMAVNIGSLLKAKQGSEDCAQKLAATDTPGTTALQYCEMPANANTQFCICRTDDKKEGCPGFVATPTTTDNKTASENGVDVKSTGAGNQFASANINGKPSGFLDSNGLGSGLNSDGSDKSKTDPSATGAGLTAGSGSGSGSGSGAGGSAPAADISGTAAKPDDKKKWNFGAFSAGGGGGGYGSGSAAETANGLGQKDMEALKRQIASENMRAEISEASGKSNWEKVSERYLKNTGKLINNK